MKELLSKVDHTLLTVGCTWDEIKALCDDAKAFGTASVCIPPCYVKKAAEYLEESEVKVCTVIGFPNGYASADAKAYETKLALIDGADEIDMVINVGFVKEKNYDAVLDEIDMVINVGFVKEKNYDAVLDEIVRVKEACDDFGDYGNGKKVLKVIIETCLLTEEEKIKMCQIVSQSGADFIKTSTGFSSGGATFDDVKLMCENVLPHVKVKAAGGISSIDDAKKFIELGAQRLGTSKVVKILKNEKVKGDY